MPTLTIITRSGQQQSLVADSGISLMEALRDGGVEDVLAMCGGMCSCATCHVYIGPGFDDAIPPMGRDEDDLLDSSSHRQLASRLSCQVPLSDALDGLVVTIAPED